MREGTYYLPETLVFTAEDSGTKAAPVVYQAYHKEQAVVSGDPYVLTVHLPAGFRLQGAGISGEKVEVTSQTETATVRIVPSTTKTVEWKMTFAK